MSVTIYALYDPRQPSKVRYVGKTVQELSARLSRHVADARTGTACHRGDWVRSLLRAGVNPQIAPLEICEENVWQQRERFWIAGHRPSGALTNNADGGEGREKGYVVSEATRLKMSEAQKGKVVSESARLKMAAAKKGQVPSEATRQKLSAAGKGRGASAATRLKISAARKAFFANRNLGTA